MWQQHGSKARSALAKSLVIPELSRFYGLGLCISSIILLVEATGMLGKLVVLVVLASVGANMAGVL